VSTDVVKTAFRNALRSVEAGKPGNIVARAALEGEEVSVAITAANLTTLLRDADEADPLLNQLGMCIHRWDTADQAEPWSAGTLPSTTERRRLVCGLLGIDDHGASALLSKRPIFHKGSVVISGPWERWYTSERADEHAFYWPRYRDYLLSVRGWPDKNVGALHRATSEVIERIADPLAPGAYQSKGLVVGYVQSGKTANFTGVTAKAIDAGYRLIIVMTGTIELLRAQTQRRMDMELVGRQNILGDLTQAEAEIAKYDYQNDQDWVDGKFLDLGVEEPQVGIRRLTDHRSDYKQQFRTLRIERIDQSKPLFDPSNLFRSAARLAIVKKNALVLKRLVTDIRANRNAFKEIPVLIIDDESDQASVNTVDPEKVERALKDGAEIKARKAINQHIASMLELMPRAQYVGYTATPFANVFVDPSDDVGIFPKDFVVALERPDGYMGVSDFHDIGSVAPADDVAESNEGAFVRHLYAESDDNAAENKELATAIDMFVLTGAVKLHRASIDPQLRYRHHTMLVHHSVKKDDHRELADQVRNLWTKAAFSRPETRARLRKLYETDVLPVSHARREPFVPTMPSFDELEPFVTRATNKILSHSNNPVIVVNSDKEIEQQTLDFDSHETWRILVGGSKLSRGFTVEGLTVTYFRRATQMSDSLTQMGRWFGFRRGYRDLVRLYIARNARFGSKTVDLYEAFESVALDEAAFREQLEKYAEWDGDKPLVRPLDIPPLVQQHLPWLQPTAKNKMFNATLVEQSEQAFTPSGYPNNLSLIKQNLELWRPILAAASTLVELPESAGGATYHAYVGVVPAGALLAALANAHYLERYGETAVEPKLTYYRRLIKEGDLQDFVAVVPQFQTKSVALDGVGPRSLVRRDRRVGRNDKFGEITDVANRFAVERFVEGSGPASLADLNAPRRGALLLYLVKEGRPSYNDDAKFPHEDPERGVIPACSIYVPESAIAKAPRIVRFQVRNTQKADEPVVESAD
jgi:hypothetical protein